MIGPLPALAPSDELDFILQAAGIGAVVGTAVAAAVRRRRPEADPWPLTASLTLLGAAVGIGLVALDRLGWL